MRCPSCESENCQRAQVAHELGTSSVSMQGEAFGIASGGSFGVGTVRGRGQVQSGLAARIAPPGQASLGCLANLALWSAATLIALAYFWKGWLVVPGLVLLVIWYRSFGRYQAGIDAENRAAWERRWICLKCGHIWETLAPENTEPS